MWLSWDIQVREVQAYLLLKARKHGHPQEIREQSRTVVLVECLPPPALHYYCAAKLPPSFGSHYVP